jgi:hypothetical protein
MRRSPASIGAHFSKSPCESGSHDEKHAVPNLERRQDAWAACKARDPLPFGKAVPEQYESASSREETAFRITNMKPGQGLMRLEVLANFGVGL